MLFGFCHSNSFCSGNSHHIQGRTGGLTGEPKCIWSQYSNSERVKDDTCQWGTNRICTHGMLLNGLITDPTTSTLPPRPGRGGVLKSFTFKFNLNGFVLMKTINEAHFRTHLEHQVDDQRYVRSSSNLITIVVMTLFVIVSRSGGQKRSWSQRNNSKTVRDRPYVSIWS